MAGIDCLAPRLGLGLRAFPRRADSRFAFLFGYRLFDLAHAHSTPFDAGRRTSK
jgi:hypothetical protein